MKYPHFYKSILLPFFLLIGFASQAQKEASIWYFGQRTGFIFSNGKVHTVEDGGNNVVVSAGITFSDGKSGELLFYGNATSIWNRNHQLMPHGDSLAPRGFNGLSQRTLAVPAPGKKNQYCVFTLVDDSTTSPAVTSLSYSVVDMSLQNELGDVVAGTKNKIVGGQYGYQFTAVRHANGQDYWVLIRRWDEPVFDTYLLTSTGIALMNSQRIGPIQPFRLSNYLGFLKASPDGKKLVYLVSDYPRISLFDFNADTGIMSHYISLGSLLSPGGVSFSPDNSKLYVQNYGQTPSPNYVGGRAYNVISQYDVAAGSDAAVIASGMSILVDNPTTNIRVDNQTSVGDYRLTALCARG